MKYVKFFSEIGIKDIPLVGGKNASLGEMFGMGLPVPNGFAVTSYGYQHFIASNKLDAEIKKLLKDADVKNVRELKKAGSQVRALIRNGRIPEDLEKEILAAFKQLKLGKVAVRSSATAEDLPDASFAGQQESYINVSKQQLLGRIKDCFASLFTDRAISYREDKGFDHFKVYLSVGVQELVDSNVSGVIFTIEPDSGHAGFVFINASWGLGDYVVQGKVNPDQYLVHKELEAMVEKRLGDKKIMEIRTAKGVGEKIVSADMRKRFVLSDKDVADLTKFAKKIEKHYKKQMDIEWAKDNSGKIYILQSRPETVHSQKRQVYKEFIINTKGADIVAKGIAIGRSVSNGCANVIYNPGEIDRFKKGEILVTRTTNPDWEPIMKMAAGIITETGASTCHAAIVSRELGIPCIVGASNATCLIKNGQKITIDCTGEDGKVLDGLIEFKLKEHDLSKLPKTKTKIMGNVGNPELALDVAQLPLDGVGLARQEFIINSYIGEHPLAMIKEGRAEEYIDKLAQGIGKIAAAFYPRPVVVRLSDFKTNEYRGLKGGAEFEIEEENPMIGWRGASRYISHGFEPAFELECKALKRLYAVGFTNIIVMVPFCRTIGEAKAVIKEMQRYGIGKMKRYVMAEIPSNIILADQFSEHFDGFSIGSNDLTQLTLGIDRGSERVASSFDERNDAVKRLIKQLIDVAHKHKRTVSICGEAPSNYPEFAEFLVKQGIDSISIQPDAIFHTKLVVAKAEKG